MTRSGGSLLWRITSLHIAAVLVMAVTLPLSMRLVLNATAADFQRETLRRHEVEIARSLHLESGRLRLQLSPDVRTLYEHAYSGFGFAVSDAAGRTLKVVRIPSPGWVEGADGKAIPASHMNFLVADRAVIVPTYNETPGRLAVEALQTLFPDRQAIGLASTAILTGGGSFHCITQQEPA